MKSNWSMVNLSDLIEFNPKETIKKGDVAKKIGMDVLVPYTRDVPSYSYEKYTGGAKFRNGDTIMARITPCLENGKISKVGILDEGEVGFGSTEYIVLRAKPGKMDPDFLYYLVCSPIVKDPAIKSMVGSSGRQRVQTDVVQSLQLLLPGLDEQKKIASVLKSIDDLIQLNGKVSQNLKEQEEAVYRSWFVENVDDGKTEFVEVSLSDLMSYAGGSQPPAEQFIHEMKDGYVRFVQIRDYETDSHLTYIPISSRNKICEEHDIMIARYGASLGRICYGINGAYNVALAKVFPKKECYREFLRCYLGSYKFYDGINNRGGRSAQAGFNQSDINSFNVMIPQEEAIMASFEEMAGALFEQQLHLKKENQKLSELRESLLSLLITGELDADAVKI